MTAIDLNADLGEGTGSDDDLLRIVSSASIACGGHAGDEATMRRVLRLCKERGIRAGAHPGYPDKPGFGRVRLDMPRSALLESLRAQIALIRRVAAEVGVAIRYVKLHGALANVAAEDDGLATDIFAAVATIDPNLDALVLDRSAQVTAAQAAGLAVVREAYADRAYLPSGLLVPRSQSGAVVHDSKAVVERCVRLARRGEIVTSDGSILQSEARSICVHGDTPDAVTLAQAIRAGLQAEGLTVAAA